MWKKLKINCCQCYTYYVYRELLENCFFIRYSVNPIVVPESVDASLSENLKITHFASVETFRAIKAKGSNSGLRCV